MRLLLVEDDAMLAEAVLAGLRQNDWQVQWRQDAAAARLALVDHVFDAVLLDLQLPGASGLSVLSWMRARYDATPVIVITARDQLGDRINGLDQGADDYLVKPFEPVELFARLRAVVRRSQGRVSPLLLCGDIELNPAEGQVLRAGQPVTLSALEYRTLRVLMERRGRVVSRDQLEQAVYGEVAVESNTIAVYIHQLRRKLGEDLIATVHGLGYRLGGCDS